MFAYLKYLAALGLIIMIVYAAFLSIYTNRYIQEDVLSNASAQVRSSISSYNSSVWDRYSSYIVRNPTSPYMPNFLQETQRFFQGHSYAKITIFSPDATIGYYNPNKEVVTTDGVTRVALFDINKALGGIAVSRIVKDVQLTNSAEPTKKRSMLQVIIPIVHSGNLTPDAFAEIYVDVTDNMGSFTRRLRWFMIAMIGLFTVMVAVFLVTANHAEHVIAKQHEVNSELIAAAAQAEAQSRDKSQFLASVSHELRTPLNAIIGFSEIIRGEVKEKLDKIYQDYVEDIHASGKHLLSLINDILDFSKAEAGKLQIEWAEADVTKIIRNSLRMVMPRAETAQVTLVEELPPNHLVIVTDPKKLKQVLLNLLSNAVKFTRAGGEVRCHAWTDLVTGKLYIEVHDTGIGIAPKDISRVMTPFGQVDSALSRKYEGTGLGLPLSKKFVESMGGEFMIESEANVGTRITIVIPKAPPGWGTPAMSGAAAKAKDEGHVA